MDFVPTFEGRSDDGDRWSEIVVGDMSYQSRGEIVNAADWCAVPVASIEGNALLQAGTLFDEVPDLLRSATDASIMSEASTATSTAYKVFFPLEETASGARVENNEATVWLDKERRLVRAEFAFTQPVGGSDEPAIAEVECVLSDWGVEVDVTAPRADEVDTFPDCSI